MNQPLNSVINEQASYQSTADLSWALQVMSRDELQRLHALIQEQLRVQVLPDSMQDNDVDCTGVSMLTGRESDVLTLIASGYTRREIGATLMISGNTAATHISAIYRKLDIGSIAEATHIAIRCGVVALM